MNSKALGQQVVGAGKAAVAGASGGALLVLVFGCLWIGQEYYTLSRQDRAFHELHGLLAPGAQLGVALGLLGTGLMVAMLLYSLRKAFPRWAWLGAMKDWLGFHILCGVFGPLAIVLHVGFVWPQGLVAVAFWCMVLVALSGLFGRYVYALMPRAASGHKLALDEARGELADLRAELVAETEELHADGLADVLDPLRGLPERVDGVFGLLRLRWQLGRRSARMNRALRRLGLSRGTTRRVRAALGRQVALRRGLAASVVAGRLMRYWHLFHRPLAGAMYVIVALHILSAVLFGGSLQQLAMLWE